MTADENRAEGHAPAQNRTLGDAQPENGSRATPDRDEAREARYAEAIERTYYSEMHDLWIKPAARAVMAVASAEVEEATAALRAEAERERGHCRWHMADKERLRKAGESLARQGFEALDRAEAAESRERALREAVASVLDSDEHTTWVGEPDGWMASSKALRAVLAQAAPTGAASPTADPDPAADTQGELSGWFRETPEALALLAEETKALVELEAAADSEGGA